jgi:hypothetical protein
MLVELSGVAAFERLVFTLDVYVGAGFVQEDFAIRMPTQYEPATAHWFAGTMLARYDTPWLERPAPVLKPSNSVDHGLRSGV